MPFRPFNFKHVPGAGDLESRSQPRYAVEDMNSGDFVETYFSAEEAAEEADRLCIAAGACRTCAGRGRVDPTLDAEGVHWQTCEECGGNGIHPG